MKGKAGRRVKLSRSRTIVSDLLRIARSAPLLPSSAQIDVQRLMKLRHACESPVSWTVILMKAYAAVAARQPELRQVFMRFPWPHLYEHVNNICLVTIEREHEGERRLFFARFDSPEADSLVDLQRKYDRYLTAPIDQIRQFRHQVSFSKLPWWLRRLAWALMMDLSPAKRVHNLGTFGVSVASLRRAEGVFHLAPTTSILGCAAPDSSGQVRVTLTWDHRVMDAASVADTYAELRKVLYGPIADELKALGAAEKGQLSTV